MFDENFSFLSSASSPVANSYTSDSYSSDVSPFTSRCSSPGPEQSIVPSQPSRGQLDTRFFTSTRPALRNASITALTARLENHSITQSPTSSTHHSEPSYSSSYMSTYTSTPTTPINNDYNFDEGFSEPPSPDMPNLDIPPYCDLNMNMTDDIDMPPTSHPSSSLSPSFALRRRQRQQLVRLQCMAREAPVLMMLIEECHPSDLPLAKSSPRSGSIGSASKLSQSARVQKIPKMRKRNTR